MPLLLKVARVLIIYSILFSLSYEFIHFSIIFSRLELGIIQDDIGDDDNEAMMQTVIMVMMMVVMVMMIMMAMWIRMMMVISYSNS